MIFVSSVSLKSTLVMVYGLKLWLVFINFDLIKHKKSEMCSISYVKTFVVAAVVGGGLMFASKTYNEDDTPVNG